MTFETVSKLAFALCLSLGLVMFFVPGLAFWLFGIDGGSSAVFIGKRVSMFFWGMAVLAFMAAETESDETRRVVSAAFATLMGGLAILGLIELARGAAGAGILVAVLIEGFFAFYFTRFLRD